MHLRTLLAVLAFVMVAPLGASELSILYRSAVKSVVSLEIQDPFGNMTKYGSGFFVADGCAIATNYHVIRGGYRVRYGAQKNAETITAPKVRVDRKKDLAVIRVSKCGSPLQLAPELPEVGEEVFAIGNPQGLNDSLSNGVISGIRTEGTQLLQTTAPISPGSSGGPLISIDGKVVGITTFYLVEGQSLNFAIPSQDILELLEKGMAVSLAEEFPDRGDPRSVAAAFFFALHRKDVGKAIDLVEPRYQTEFEQAMRSNAPSIPKDAVLKVAEGKPIGGAPHSEVSIEGTGIGIDVVKYRDGWWVTK